MKRIHIQLFRQNPKPHVFLAAILIFFVSFASPVLADAEIDTTIRTSFDPELNPSLYLIAQNESHNSEIDQFRQEEIDSRERIKKRRQSKFLKSTGRFLKLTGVVVGVGGGITGLAMIECEEEDENGD